MHDFVKQNLLFISIKYILLDSVITCKRTEYCVNK